jgi:hypothetical protein
MSIYVDLKNIFVLCYKLLGGTEKWSVVICFHIYKFGNVSFEEFNDSVVQRPIVSTFL